MSAFAGCRYCGGGGCLACEGEAARIDAPALTVFPLLGAHDPLVVTHPQGNPCVTVFGADARGRKCAGCRHLHEIVYSRTVFKCDLRPRTGGAGTDHRKRWPACARYEKGGPHRHMGDT